MEKLTLARREVSKTTVLPIHFMGQVLASTLTRPDCIPKNP